MRIWYQSYVAVGADSRWGYYEEALRKHIPKIARIDTEVDIHGVDKFSPRLFQSRYFQYLHMAQIVEKALQAEREGYDAFVLGGMRDFAYFELREAVDIPVAFIAESSYNLACLLAPKFSLIDPNEVSLRSKIAIIKRYGLEEHYVPGVHIGSSLLELVEGFEKNPEGVIDMVRKAAKKVIEQDAGILVPGFGGLSVFLAEQDVREIDGVPIMDNQAALIKMAEMLVDLKRLGVTKSKKGLFNIPSKEEIMAARKLYGVD